MTLYKQTISHGHRGCGPDQPAGWRHSDVTVTVLDQNGKAVAGADVTQDGAAPQKQTNSQGVGQFTVSGHRRRRDGTTFAYFVDENGNDTLRVR